VDSGGNPGGASKAGEFGEKEKLSSDGFASIDSDCTGGFTFNAAELFASTDSD
jgi:hypothetical protein